MSLPGPSERRRLFAGHALFDKLPPEDLDALLLHARLERFPAGRAIFAKGSPGRSMMAILKGSVRISTPSPAGPDIVLALLRPGEVFGEIALLDGADRTADARAVTDSEPGQAQVARYLGSTDASAAIGNLAEEIAHETDGRKVLAAESRAASVYWKAWETVPVRFSRQNPERLAPNGQWRPGRPDYWLSFGPRSSLLTGRPHRASTPGNALLNYLYGVLAGEMAVALYAVGLDPGIGIFHSDIDRRASLALDAIEAVRPYADHWLLDYLASSAFANRDFTELPDGEVRLTHPLNAHLAHTAALWRKVCEPVADWLAHSFGRGVLFGDLRRCFSFGGHYAEPGCYIRGDFIKRNPIETR